jgi:hypothetical protein
MGESGVGVKRSNGIGVFGWMNRRKLLIEVL